MKTIILNSDRQKTYAENLIKESPADGSMTVIIKTTDVSSTAAQRRLAWLWYTEIAASGLGSEDTKEGVHTVCKWLFAKPILLRDDEVFGAVFAGFSQMVEQVESGTRAEYWREFTRDFISTERMSRKQRSEYLSDLQRYWTGKGVNLSDPDDLGRDLLKFR